MSSKHNFTEDDWFAVSTAAQFETMKTLAESGIQPGGGASGVFEKIQNAVQEMTKAYAMGQMYSDPASKGYPTVDQAFQRAELEMGGFDQALELQGIVHGNVDAAARQHMLRRKDRGPAPTE